MTSLRSRTGTGQPERQECSSRSRAIRVTFAENSGGPVADGAGAGAADGTAGGASDGEAGAGVGETGWRSEAEAEGEGEEGGVAAFEGAGDTVGGTGSGAGVVAGPEPPQAATARQAVNARAARTRVTEPIRTRVMESELLTCSSPPADERDTSQRSRSHSGSENGSRRRSACGLRPPKARPGPVRQGSPGRTAPGGRRRPGVVDSETSFRPLL
ncbi:hypothetical protein Pve01_27970 [Planomonospora venezuelensis]|nr:hypothetical protein Pve01_27970 [Planomonospora venezuelensis]